MRVPRPRSLAGQLFAMQVVLVALVVAGSAVFTYFMASSDAERAAIRQVENTARAVAAAPGVAPAITNADDPTAVLQPYADDAMYGTRVAFVTIMAPDGTRFTHPDPDKIGKDFRGHTARALRGGTFHETYTGTLGRSVRAVTPVRAADGRIVGLVSAGIKVDQISAEVRENVLRVLWVALGALALGGAGTYLINARLRRHTHGMNAAELSRLHDYHQATLHAVREGLLLVDADHRVVLMNDAAHELLGVAGTARGRSVADLGLTDPLTEALLSDAPRTDDLHLTRDRVIVVNTSPVTGGERRGTVVTLRDVTELQALTGELDSVRGFADALRAQAHESANRLHTVVSLIELGRADEAVEFATAELELAQALTDQVTAAVAEPVLAALLLGKAAQANEQGVELSLAPDSRIEDDVLPRSLPARDLVTVLGNLIDNAIDAARAVSDAVPRVTVALRATDGELRVSVADNGPGIAPAAADDVFERGWTTKPAGPGGRGLGLALVRQVARRHGGEARVDRAESGGAKFTVRLPLQASQGRGQAGRGAARVGTAGPADATETGTETVRGAR
ncbi:ATP-binding protein [Streptomyces boninensis]|uniref:sensor histidine kinase n=1 Tax=Streptomyces boninensis TaxID=2039455 RepID=UPI003B222E22